VDVKGAGEVNEVADFLGQSLCVQVSHDDVSLV